MSSIWRLRCSLVGVVSLLVVASAAFAQEQVPVAPEAPAQAAPAPEPVAAEPPAAQAVAVDAAQAPASRAAAPDAPGALEQATLPRTNIDLPTAKDMDLDAPLDDDAQANFEAEGPPRELADAGADDEVLPLERIVEETPHLILLGADVPPATATRLAWSPRLSFEGIASPTPVLVVHGANPGPVVCLTAAIHGDELNGIEIVRRILYNIEPEELSGTVIGVPIVNLQGFQRSSRYLTDRRDLNRFFPGDPTGSSASRKAYSFFNEVILGCDALVDLHTGSFHRTNLPQLRADLSNPGVVELTQGFGATVVLQSEGTLGTLRRAAVETGIPAITLEAGEPQRLQEDAVSHGVKGIQTLLNHLGMIKKTRFWSDTEPVYYNSAWVRADRGGILFSEVELGERVKEDAVLGTVTNPITNVRTEIRSPYKGRVLGMALNQVVMPGYASFHVGIQAPEAEISQPDREMITAPDKVFEPMLDTYLPESGDMSDARDIDPGEDVDVGVDSAEDVN
jgi:predicted deacylase